MQNIISKDTLKEKLEFYIKKECKIDIKKAKIKDFYTAFSFVLNDILKSKKEDTEAVILNGNNKFAAYFSIEYLFGKLALQNLLSLKLYNDFKQIFKSYKVNIDDVLELESSTQLGNGGLGRLAACFFDSFATKSYPLFGYGLLYKNGIFKQVIKNNKQVEENDTWLSKTNPGLIKTNIKYNVNFGGKITTAKDIKNIKWSSTEKIEVVANDLCIAGYDNNKVLSVRLWQSKNAITDNLYPKDHDETGKLLRLKQEYVLVSASVQDLFNRFKKMDKSIEKYISIQLNDTHPTLTFIEIIRILMLDYSLDFETAYNKATKICSYTNHTLLPEALEVVSIDLLKKLLPYHYYLIQKIDERFKNFAKTKIKPNAIKDLQIIDKNVVRLGNLCFIMANKVNGVAKLHSDLLKKQFFPLYYKLFPKKFINETNGITQRKWLLEANPLLSNYITDKIGDDWITDLSKIKNLLKFKRNSEVLKDLENVKNKNKLQLIKYIRDNLNINIPTNFMIDTQIKRMHEYKRQLLCILQIIDRYNKIKQGRVAGLVPKAYIFAGKSHPSYEAGKEIITLINDVATIINNDRACKNLLRVVFIPNYNVDIAKIIIAGSELSEQISQAGKEASGTGNMKLALNGALTIGTLDGANVEIRKNVGRKNIFIFGNKVKQVKKLQSKYNPSLYINNNIDLKQAIEDIQSGKFGDKKRYSNLMNNLLSKDEFMVCADFESYVKTQLKIDEVYKDKKTWYKKVIRNIANCGFFSSDRTVSGYAKDIWKIKEIK